MRRRRKGFNYEKSIVEMRTSIVLMAAAAGGVHGYVMPPIKDISARSTFSASSTVSANSNFLRAGAVSSPPLRMSSAPEGEAKLPPGWDQFEGKTAEYFAVRSPSPALPFFSQPQTPHAGGEALDFERGHPSFSRLLSYPLSSHLDVHATLNTHCLPVQDQCQRQPLDELIVITT